MLSKGLGRNSRVFSTHPSRKHAGCVISYWFHGGVEALGHNKGHRIGKLKVYATYLPTSNKFPSLGPVNFFLPVIIQKIKLINITIPVAAEV
jgi:hypothetical protein